MAACFLLWMQSLSDIARQEAERRKLLEQQGIEGKVIEPEAVQSSQKGSLTVSTNPPSKTLREKPETAPKGQASLRSFKSTLQKLDRAIRQNEERLESRRARLQSARSEILLKSGRTSSGGRQSNTANRLQEEIEDLEMKLRQLREERFETYRAGKKAGFLPGELDGKGIIP